MFVTLSLNPAIDETVELDVLRPGAVNLARHAMRHAGGKGINVAACLADWGARRYATGLLGEANDAPFCALFVARGIADRCVRIPGETRTNIKLLDRSMRRDDRHQPARHRAQPGGAGCGARRAACGDRGRAASPCSPAACRPACRPRPMPSWSPCCRSRARGWWWMPAARRCPPCWRAPALPHAVKPNRYELEAWAGKALPDRAALLAAARGLVARGIAVVAVSLGAEGAMFVTADAAVMVHPPTIAVGSSVGAGDAMVAGIAAGLGDGLPLAALARRAAAFSAAKLQQAGAQLPGRAAVEAIAAAIRAEPLA